MMMRMTMIDELKMLNGFNPFLFGSIRIGVI